MKMTTLVTALAISLSTAGLAKADSHRGHGAPQGNDSAAAPMGDQSDMMQGMMRMMMQMHGELMGRGKMGAHSDRPANAMGMMDRDMMQMMMGTGTPGTRKPEDMRSMMMMRMTEFDADGDGNLTLPEFEAMHGAMVRETMVDRFQHLDADGDGRITGKEMEAPAHRMQRSRGDGPMHGMTEGQMPPAGN